MPITSKKVNCRLVIQVKEEDHGHQVIDTHAIRMDLTEEQIAVLSEVFATSDHVQSFIWGRKIEN